MRLGNLQKHCQRLGRAPRRSFEACPCQPKCDFEVRKGMLGLSSSWF